MRPTAKATAKETSGSSEQVEKNIDEIYRALRALPYYASHMSSGIERYVKVIKEKK